MKSFYNKHLNPLVYIVLLNRKAKGGDDGVTELTESNADHVSQNNDGSQNSEANSQKDLESLLNDDDDFLAELDDDIINGVNSNGRINQPRASTQPITIIDDGDNVDIVSDNQFIMDDESLRHLEENADDFSR